MTGRVDGRRARGDRRRELLLDAAVAVIARDGAGSLTHRAVAAEAGIPHASAAYYFPTVDDVLVAALTRTGRRYEQAVDDTAAEQLRTDADLVTTLVAAVRQWQVPPDGTLDPATVAAEYELYLLAARRPDLTPIALGWVDRLLALLAGRGIGPDRAAAVAALVEGVLLQSLLGRSMSDDRLRSALRALLS